MTNLQIKFFFSTAILAGFLALPLSAAALQVSLADPAWNGQDVPEGQQCQRFGGQDPQSPSLLVEQIPPEADALVLEFSDRNVAAMDKGGHGTIGYRLSGQTTVTIPPVRGHTEDLPPPFFIIAQHKAPQWDLPGAYLPPCSGGRGHDYFVDVKAVTLNQEQKVEKVIASSSVKLATY